MSEPIKKVWIITQGNTIKGVYMCRKYAINNLQTQTYTPIKGKRMRIWQKKEHNNLSIAILEKHSVIPKKTTRNYKKGLPST